jgi:hypothetical protein
MASTYPVVLQTAHGRKYYADMLKVFEIIRTGKSELAIFKQGLVEDNRKLERRLSHFLRDEDQAKKYRMDEVDKRGWKMYKELSDEFSVQSYFLRRAG